jgi:hypothetical protein
LSKKRNAFLRLLKDRGFKEESRTKVGLNAIGTSTTLESNKSHVTIDFIGDSVYSGYAELQHVERPTP